MESIIHGTKGGYKIFYKTPNVPASIAGDVRRMEGMDAAAIGQIAYAISIAGTGFAYSKYIIIRDESRGAVGNIVVSVYLSAAEQMMGLDIKELLDELLECFKTNDEAQQHNWSFVDQLLAKYKYKIRPHTVDASAEGITKGTADPAFIYYKSEEDLCKFFETPQRKEYYSYKQVFFVDVALRDRAENPLNALSHERVGDLTDKVLLDNPCYRLNEFSGKAFDDVAIEIKANNMPLKNGDFIYLKDAVELCYSKDYYERFKVFGRLGDEDIEKYICINNHTLKVTKDVNLMPKSKVVQFQVVGKDGQTLQYARLECNNTKTGVIKSTEGHKVEFKGEEIGQTWRLTYSLNNKKGQLDIVPASASYHTLKLNVRVYDGSAGSVSGRERGSSGRVDLFLKWLLYIMIGAVVVIGALNLTYSSNGSKDEPTIPRDKHVVAYTEGVDLNLDTLNSYKDLFCLDESSSDSKSKPAKTVGPFAFLPSCSRKQDDAEPKRNQAICKQIEGALQIRKAIIEGNIDYLKTVKKYKTNQQKFGSAINGIDGSQVAAISQKLRDLPDDLNLPLNAIVDSIDSWSRLAVPAAVERNEHSSASSAASRPAEKPRVDVPVAKREQKDNTAEIEKLREEFWRMIEGEVTKKESFDAWCKKYVAVMDDYTDEYRKFYNVHLSRSEKFEFFLDIPRICRQNHSRDLSNLIRAIENPDNCE